MHFKGSCAGKGNSDAPLESGHVVGFALDDDPLRVTCSGKAFSWVTGSLECATFATLRPTSYHLFSRRRKKMAPPVIRARMTIR
jgi:hypothetical protein